MERVGMAETGRAIAYLKDGFEELAMMELLDHKVAKQDLRKDETFYQLPVDSLAILDIQIQGHNNQDNEFRSIPRLVYEPTFKDTDDE